MKAIILTLCFCFSSLAFAQPVELADIRWKSEQSVRGVLGDPNSIRGPVGTHATYTLWQYDDYTVAFANQRAFHLFRKDALTKFELQESR